MAATSIRAKANADIDLTRAARERARAVELSGGAGAGAAPAAALGPLTAADLSSAHLLAPFRHRKGLLHCLSAQPLLMHLLAGCLAMMEANKLAPAAAAALAEGEPEEGVIELVPGALYVRTPDAAAAARQLRLCFAPALALSMCHDVAARLVERAAAAWLSDGSDADRGRWTRELKAAADEAGAACKRFGVTGWDRSWRTAHYLCDDVVPRLAAVQLCSGLAVDSVELLARLALEGCVAPAELGPCAQLRKPHNPQPSLPRLWPPPSLAPAARGAGPPRRPPPTPLRARGSAITRSAFSTRRPLTRSQRRSTRSRGAQRRALRRSYLRRWARLSSSAAWVRALGTSR